MIRRIEIPDADAVAAVSRSARFEAIPDYPDLHTPEEDRAFYRGRIQAASGLVWVDEGGQVTGFVIWEGDLVEHLYVAPGAQRAGIGTRLLEAAVDEMGVPAVRLWTFQANERAVAFYRKRGFGVLERTDGRGNEAGLPDVLFARPLVLLETPRLILRRPRFDDADDLVALDSDPEVMHFVTGGLPTSRAEIDDVILPAWLAYGEVPGVIGYWIADDRRTGEFLGWFHLRPGDGHPLDEPELGYRLRRSVWGQGLATEGSRALIDAAFARGGARRVLAETMLVHHASRRVMEKAGMTLRRTFRADWPYRIPGDELGDVEYAVEREGWIRVREASPHD